jgi:hypothetical protein
MARQVITITVTIPASGPNPARTLKAGQVVELSAAELAALTGAGGAVRATAFRDTLGEATAVSNSN